LQWQFTLTNKGTQRAKNLAKSVGLLIKLEVDIEASLDISKHEPNSEEGFNRVKSINKVTINMYDKELMPVVDDLYLNDQSMVLLSMKQEGKQEELNGIFADYIQQIENQLGVGFQSLPVKQDHCLMPFHGDDEDDIIQDEEEEPVLELKTMVKHETHVHAFSEVILIVDNREKRN
jgi:hypothetical protein